MKRYLWCSVLCVVLCACLLLSGCGGTESVEPDNSADPVGSSDESAASAGTTTLIPSEERRDPFINDQYQYAGFCESLWGPCGILDREQNVLVSPTYEGIVQMANDRFYAFPGGGVGVLIDQTGRVLIPDTGYDVMCNIDVKTAEDLQGKPVRFCAGGQLYDADGGKIGEPYEKMEFDLDGAVLAQNSEGFFELDLDGKRLRRLDEVQHDYTDEIVSTMHVHLDHHNCLEILALKGRGERVYELADRLLGLRGVKHGELTCAATKQSLGL